MTRQSKRFAKGFTLTELLVVIAIIAVLAVLSFAGYGRMRSAADRTGTISNLRQLQNANVSYSSDNNGRFASYFIRDEDGAKVYWYRNSEFLAYFTGDDSRFSSAESDLSVPPSMLDPVVIRAKKRAYSSMAASYGMNWEFMPKRNDEDTERYIEASRVSDPARSAAFITCTDGNAKYNGRKLWWNSPVEGKTTDGKMAFRYDDKAVVVYFDGSTGFVTRQDIARFDSSGGKNHRFWKADQ